MSGYSLPEGLLSRLPCHNRYFWFGGLFTNQQQRVKSAKLWSKVQILTPPLNRSQPVPSHIKTAKSIDHSFSETPVLPSWNTHIHELVTSRVFKSWGLYYGLGQPLPEGPLQAAEYPVQSPFPLWGERAALWRVGLKIIPDPTRSALHRPAGALGPPRSRPPPAVRRSRWPGRPAPWRH